jgi:hypothetical protein
MTSNILRIFGILVLVCLVYLVISIGNKTNQPAMVAAKTFMTAFAKHDLETVKSLLDTSVSSVSHAGNQITGIEFQAQHISESAFANTSAVKYSYLDIIGRRIPRDAVAVMPRDGEKATVALEMTVDNKPVPGGSIYLRQVEGQWKVFYVQQPEEKK